MNKPIRVLIADDHEVVREGLRMILETKDDFEVVAEAGDGAEAVALSQKLRPHVVLMDLRMPRMDGLEAIEHIKDHQPEVAVVILTTYDEDDLMVRGLRAGAVGYLLKDTNRQSLFNALRAAAQGEALLAPEVIARILAEQEKEAGIRAEAAEHQISLTDREEEVLTWVARGATSKKVAQQLGITERTVKAHLTSIFNKLGVDSRAAAVAVAMQQDMLPNNLTDPH
jgi:NarL family two-component system response regulator YdfI